jgi:hypothetical protein
VMEIPRIDWIFLTNENSRSSVDDIELTLATLDSRLDRFLFAQVAQPISSMMKRH